MSSILITGGTGNLGRTVVETLSKAGYTLHLPVRDLNQEAQENVFYYEADLSSPSKSEAMVSAVLNENKDVLAGVFLAGGFVPGGLDVVTLDIFSKMATINFATAFNSAKSLITNFQQNEGGKLIFIGAKAAMHPKTAPQNAAYALSKQLLFNFSEMVNTSENKHNITAHILLPGTIDTALNRSLMPDADSSKWTSPDAMASTIGEIIAGTETRTVIEF